jgi:hypothetical protein
MSRATHTLGLTPEEEISLAFREEVGRKYRMEPRSARPPGSRLSSLPNRAEEAILLRSAILITLDLEEV